MDEDNLRDILGVSSAYQEEDEEEVIVVPPPVRIEPVWDGRILGMTAPQRAAVAAMVFVLTFIMGSLLLVIANKITLPF